MLTSSNRFHDMIVSCLRVTGVAFGCTLWLLTNNLQAQNAASTPPVAEPPATDTPPIPSAEPTAPESLPAPPPAPAPATEAADDFKLDVGGGMILFYNQPLTGPGKGNFEVFEARLRIDATFGMFGMHIVPIARDTKERAFFPGTAWVQEAYAFAKLDPVVIKVGKVWAQFGRFWDNSFYGNVQEYDGFKLDPNHGISVEGKLAFDKGMGMDFYAQYFITDGVTNYSLPGRDTMSIPGARRRNYFVGRVEPSWKVNDDLTLKAGLSASYFQADLPTIGKQDVGRLSVDATVMWRGLTAWAEYTRQIGRHTLDFPIAPVLAADGSITTPGRSADGADYVMLGGEYVWERLTFRLNYNLGSYNVGVKEARIIPGIAVMLDPRLFVLFEYAHEYRYGEGARLLGSSFNLTIHGKV